MSTIIDPIALSQVERTKLESRGLRGTLASELASDSTHLSEEATQLLKFHGSYEQEDRDQRRERKMAGLEPAYQYMIRSKLPGGAMSAEQYLTHDEIASKYGNATLRITTRQGFQIHGTLKGNLWNTIHELNEALMTTLGACGDIVRNVCTCPAPLHGGLREEVIALSRLVRDETFPTTRSYHEIWVEGTQLTQDVKAEEDPLYQARYLPRKFKINFAFPEDNCTDLLANDLGFLVIVREGKIVGYNVFVGGGLGQTHGKAETYPRLASPLGFVLPEDVIRLTKAIIAVQRDYGNRTNRKRARMKYLLDERGIDWFRAQVEQYLGSSVDPSWPIEISGVLDHLGWHEQDDGRCFLGIRVENGRVQDTAEVQLRLALRDIITRFRPDVHLTTQQNLLLVNVSPSDKGEIDQILAQHGVISAEALSPARRSSMSCPALPTCPLALGEAERVFPSLITQMEEVLLDLGLQQQALSIRMTGCPNGCARPYTADIAFVGRSLNKYAVYLGGNPEGTRLANVYADLIPLEQLTSTVRPILETYSLNRQEGEGFGDFVHRMGLEPLPSAARLAS